MNNRAIEQYLKKMIEIDREAVSIEERIKEGEAQKDKELRKAKRALEMDILKRARMEARKEMERQLEEAKKIELEIQSSTERELELLRAAYKEAEPQLISQTVQMIIAMRA